MDYTVKQLSDKLGQQAEAVCQKLLPGGRMEKGNWICGDVSGSPGKSLVVHLQGEHAGEWRDWADEDQRGDLIDLWRIARNCSLPEALTEIKDYLGIVSAIYAPDKVYASAPKRDDIKDFDPNGKAMQWLVNKRMLEPRIVNRFKIQGCDGKAIVFPCYSPSGCLVNRSYRTLEGQKQVWQDKGCGPCLFGWHALDESAYRSRTVLLCEGQIDAATWTQWGINALSIPNGSGQTWIEYEWNNLAAFDRIYISFDMDGAGRANAEKSIARLGKHRCLIVSLPEKDANDCLLAGHTAEHAKQWIDSAKAPEFKNLVQAKDLEKRVLIELQPKPDCFTLPFFRLKDPEHGFYPRPGELTIWTGTTGSGKSTLLDYMSLSIAAKGTCAFIASMESKAERILRRMMSAFLSRRPSPTDVKDCLEEFGSQLVFADVVGYIKESELLEMMEYAFRRYGAEHFIIDSLMRVEGLEEDYVKQGDFVNKLQKFVKTNMVHCHLVCHPRKGSADGRPGKEDVKGSSLLPNNADNIVSVCRNPDKEKLRKDGTLTDQQNATMHDTEVIVNKQRETGWEGRFLLRFHPLSYTYSAIEAPLSPNKQKPKSNYFAKNND
jgi:twinkle protein